MRFRNAASFLALPAFLASLAWAVPSPSAYFQHPLSAAAPPPPSRLRAFSDAVIDSIWKPLNEKGERIWRHSSRPDLKPPPHTLARYGGDVVLRFNLTTEEEARGLADAADILLLDVWEFTGDWVDIRLNKDVVPSLLGLLPKTMQQSYTPLLREQALAQAIWDTYPTPYNGGEQVIDHPTQRVRPFSPNQEPRQDDETNMFFQDFQPLSVIGPWMKLLASLFTTHVRLINIGKSYEGRDIQGLRVGVHPTNNDDPEQGTRKTILITGGAHAREWISTSTVTYVAYSLITGYGKNPSITWLLEDFDFVFIPTINPDGYVYTWRNDRLWRKNRQRTSLRFCQGLDLDRSFGFEWDGMTATAGNPCSESFGGESPFEATEAKRLADWARNETENNNVNFISFLDFHSYSQQILYPYGYSCDAYPPSLENLEELAMGLSKTIRLSHGHYYDVLPACEGNVAFAQDGTAERLPLRPRMESRGGSALDWFYQELHVRYTYQIKLRDKGSYGFLLPKENIVPTGREMLQAVLHLGNYVSAEVNGESKTEKFVEVKRDHGEDQRSSERAVLEEALRKVTENLESDDMEGEKVGGDGVREYLRRR